MNGEVSSGCEPEAHVLEIEAENRLDEIRRVIAAFDAFARERKLADGVRRRVDLALDDLLNNVISYGYDDDDDDGRHLIGVRVELSSDRLVLRVKDEGRPFNPLLTPPPDVTRGMEDREPGGLGIHLFQNLMDEVSYDRRGDSNVMVLVKHLPLDDAQGERNES